MMDSRSILGGRFAKVRCMGLVALLASGLLMTGCGQKGPLFIKPAEARQHPAEGTASVQGTPSTPAGASSTR